MEKHYLTTRVSRVNWGGIFAGGLTAIAVSFLLNLLGIGIGLSTVDFQQDANPVDGLGTGSLIWFVISNLIALFCGGWIAGRMAGFPNKKEGGLHGFLAWVLYTTVTFMFLGSTVSGIGGAVSSVFTGGNKNQHVVVDVNQNDNTSNSGSSLSLDKAKSELFKLINKGEEFNILPSDASEEVRAKLEKADVKSEQMIKDLNIASQVETFAKNVDVNIDDNGHIHIDAKGDYYSKEDAKKYLAKHTDLTEKEINDVLNNWDRQFDKKVQEAEKAYNEGVEKAKVYGDKAVNVLSKVAIYGFFALLLGIVVAFFGGTLGAPLHTIEAFDRDRH